MVPSNFGYSLREAGHHFRRNWTTVLGAIVTIFLSLFIIGLFVLGSVMISSVVGGVEDSVTIQAYLSDSASDAAVEDLQSEISSWDNVESVTYKSKDEALEEYRTSMSNRNASDAVAALDGENPLPASLVITLTDPQEVADTAERIMNDASFAEIRDTADDPESSPSDDVVYGQGTVDRLFEVTNYIRIGAVVLVAMLTFVAFVFINNTIRLAITARRREIAIMRLVGASNSFIRGPFVMEGVLEAFIAALLAIAALAGGMQVLMPMLQDNLSFLAFNIPNEVLYATFGGSARHRHRHRPVWLGHRHEALPQGLARPIVLAVPGAPAFHARVIALGAQNSRLGMPGPSACARWGLHLSGAWDKLGGEGREGRRGHESQQAASWQQEARSQRGAARSRTYAHGDARDLSSGGGLRRDVRGVLRPRAARPARGDERGRGRGCARGAARHATARRRPLRDLPRRRDLSRPLCAGGAARCGHAA